MENTQDPRYSDMPSRVEQLASGVAPPGMQKHLRLWVQIQRLQEIEYHIAEIYSRMNTQPDGPTTGGPTEPDLPQPSLVEMLNETPDLVSRRIETLHRQLTELNEAIFG